MRDEGWPPDLIPHSAFPIDHCGCLKGHGILRVPEELFVHMGKEDFSRFTVHMIANAHVDPAWLWQWKEGRDEVFNTYRSALNLMREFPQLTFTCSAAVTYRWIEEARPAMFDEIRAYVAEGRWEIVNGWWVQPDCNLPAGESFVRHSLYGKGYFLDKFGVDVKTGYNVDSFGHCSALPMILKRAGFEHYVFFRPGPHEKELPGNMFWWESDDGSRVLALRAPHHYGTWGLVDFAERVTDACRMWNSPTTHLACFYGMGNHGGGPTREHIRDIMNVQQMPGMPRIEFSTLGRFFQAALAESTDYPVVHDDLQHHAVGCYTAVSEIKRENRQCESLLLASERMGTCAASLGGPSRRHVFAQAWQKVLFNQFHDILAGSSIRPVYDDVAEDYAAVRVDANAVLSDSLDLIAREMNTQGPGQPLVLFNTLPWERSDAVVADLLLPDFNTQFRLVDADGRELPVQVIDRVDQAGGCRTRACFVARMPALGCTVLRMLTGEAPAAAGGLTAFDATIENARCKIVADPETGWIVSLLDKQHGIEWFTGPGCVPVVINDPSDTWSHGVVDFRDEIGRFRGSAQAVECGPVRTVLRVRQCWGDSTIEQDFIIYNGLDRIDCEMRIDWRERHRMLKLSVPVNVSAPRAIFEVPMGTIERQPLGHEEPGLRWVDVEGVAANGKPMGMLVANDSKYGYDFKDNELRISVLRSPIYAFHEPRTVEGHKKYLFTDQGRQVVRYSLLPHEGDWRQAGAMRQGHSLNNSPITLQVAAHAGKLGGTVSFMQVEPDTVLCEVLKQAEDGRGLVVRVLETGGTDAQGVITIPLLGVTHEFAIGRNVVKTFRIVDGTVSETDLLER